MKLQAAINEALAAGYTLVDTAGGRYSLDKWPESRHGDEFRQTEGWQLDNGRLVHKVDDPGSKWISSVFPLGKYVSPFVYMARE